MSVAVKVSSSLPYHLLATSCAINCFLWWCGTRIVIETKRGLIRNEQTLTPRRRRRNPQLLTKKALHTVFMCNVVFVDDKVGKVFQFRYTQSELSLQCPFRFLALSYSFDHSALKKGINKFSLWILFHPLFLLPTFNKPATRNLCVFSHVCFLPCPTKVVIMFRLFLTSFLRVSFSHIYIHSTT